MSAAVTIAALPVAALVLRALLRSPFGMRLVRAPSGERWHESATPLFGGVGIYCGLMAGIALAAATGALDSTRLLLGIVAACSILFLAGLVDDIRHLSPAAKLAAQQLGAIPSMATA